MLDSTIMVWSFYIIALVIIMCVNVRVIRTRETENRAALEANLRELQRLRFESDALGAQLEFIRTIARPPLTEVTDEEIAECADKLQKLIDDIEVASGELF